MMSLLFQNLKAKIIQRPVELFPVSPPFTLACVFHVCSFPFPVFGQQVSWFFYLSSSPLTLRPECDVTSPVDISAPVTVLILPYTPDLVCNFWAVHLNQCEPVTLIESLKEKILEGDNDSY